MTKLEQLKKLNEARTKGPWKFERGTVDGVLVTSPRQWICEGMNYEDGADNAAFIATLANNADWLLGCVEALQWYADFENHKGKEREGMAYTTPVDDDFGKRARAALEAKDD